MSKSPSFSITNVLSLTVPFFCNLGLAVNSTITAGPLQRRNLFYSTRKSGFPEILAVITENAYSNFGLKNTFDGGYACVAIWGDTMPIKEMGIFHLHGQWAPQGLSTKKIYCGYLHMQGLVMRDGLVHNARRGVLRGWTNLLIITSPLSCGLLAIIELC